MANKKITELTDLPSPAGADILAIVDDVAGTATTKKVTVTNLMTLAPVQTSDISGFATTVSLGNHESLTSSVHGISAFGATLVDDADEAAARTTLGLGTAATTASTDYATSAQGGLADTAVQPTDSIDVLSDVDTSTVAPTTNDFLKWGGSNWVPAVPTADVDTPLTTALRGTDNPHIGAFPNQSFKVIDNPKKLVMVIATDSGDLDFLLPDGGSIFLNTPTGGRLAPGFGFSVQEDATEPDIEVASGGENYSVISGDSDTKGPNGLPIRQGFNVPDIGANPAPLLISGGSIA